MNCRSARWLMPVLVVLLLVPLGCMRNGIERGELDFTRSKPDVADLVGTWIPTAPTLRDMQNRGGYLIETHELRLADDGSCGIVGMPDWWRDPSGESKGRFESGVGTWKVIEDEDASR